jgi:chemotaxis protein methyltransferase CheR
LLTRSYANRGELPEAEKWCRKAIEAAKLNPHYRYLLAGIQVEQGKTADAAASLKKSLYINPDFIPAHFMLGHIAVREQNHTEAQRCFDNTLSLLAGLEDHEPAADMEDGLTVGRIREIITVLKEKEFVNERK